jgi:fucose permease
MITRKFFLIGLLLVVLALGLHLTALRYGAHSVQSLTEAMKTPADAERLRPERASVSRHLYAALYVGVACAMLSAFFAFLSYRVDEPAPRSIIVVLLLFYGLLHFAAV